MKIAWITTFYRDKEKKDIERLKKEIAQLHLRDWKIFVTDKRQDNKGYAAGINIGLKQAHKEGFDIFIICNPDISIKSITACQLLSAYKHFDIWGGAMRQNNTIYYGGEIDRWRMSGGLIIKKPDNRFVKRDFVSGAFMVVKRKVIDKIGFLEEKYFIYYEEVDFCHKADASGFKVGIDCRLVYDHFEKSDIINPKKNYLLSRNRLWFFWKYSNWQQKLRELIRLPKTLYEEINTRNLFARESFLYNFFSMNITSFLVKIISFVNFLFLVRYLTSSEYGIYSLVWAQVTLLSPLADFGTTSYSIVHLKEENKELVKSLLSLRLLLSVFIFILTVIFSFILVKANLKVYLYIFVMATFIFSNTFSGSYLILSAIKNKLYLSSRNSLIFNFIIVVATIICLLIWKRLLYVFLLLFILYNLYSLFNIWLIRKEIGSIKIKLIWSSWKGILNKSYIFVLISFFAGLYFHLDVFILQALKGLNEVGIYSAGYKFFDALLFMAASYNLSSTPIMSKYVGNKTHLANKIRKDFIFLTFVGLATVILIWSIAPTLLPIFFKNTFLPSIMVLKIVIFALPLILVNSIMMNLIYVLKKSYFVIFVFVIQTILNALLNFILIPRYSYIASAYVTVISELINAVLLFLICRSLWHKIYSKNI